MVAVPRRSLGSVVVLVIVTVTLGVAGAEPARAGSGSCRPAVTALPGLGGTFAEARGANRSGVTVGGAQTADGRVKAVWWGRDGRVRTIETGSGVIDTALDANDAGAIVGIADNPETGLTRGWYRSKRGKVTFLPVPAGVIGSYAARINNAGRVAGYVFFDTERFAPALWSTPSSRPVLLARLPGRPDGLAFGINDAGTVVGGLGVSFGDLIPARWRHARPALLRVGGVAVPGIGNDVNNRGQVAGTANRPSGGEQAVRWSADGTARPLGVLPGGSTSVGLGISAQGWVTGRAEDRTGLTRAVVWPGHGPLRTLPALVRGGATTGNAVDNAGTVVGQSDAAGEVSKAVRWRCAFGR